MIIADLRKRIEEFESKSEDSVSDDLTAKVKSLEEDLATNAKALQDAKQSSAIFEKEFSDLNEQINMLTAQVTKVLLAKMPTNRSERDGCQSHRKSHKRAG